MSFRVKDLISFIEDFAHPMNAQAWDNIGLQIGEPDALVKRVLVSLDLNLDVVFEAIQAQIDLIIVHHTPFFKPLHNILLDTPQGKLIQLMINHHINLYCAHTNLDACWGGVNDVLAEILELKEVQILQPNSPALLEAAPLVPIGGLGRVGNLGAEKTLSTIIVFLKEKLKIKQLRYVGDLDQRITRIALCGGSGSDLINQAIFNKAQLFITADLKYHEAQEAESLGLALIDAGHYATEHPVVDKIVSLLSDKTSGKIDIQASQINTDPFCFL